MNLLAAIIIWRVALFVLAAIASAHFNFLPSFPYSDIYLIPSGLPQWIWSWANFDGVHYLTIAKLGYWAQFTQTFFPLYPLVLRYMGFILHDPHLIITGILISFVAFMFVTHYLRKLWNLDYAENLTQQMLISLLLFPTSFYFTAVYTESIFLLLVVLSFWWARQKKWWLSAIVAALASATRLTGIFLLPALLWEWHHGKIKNKKLKSKKNSIISAVEALRGLLKSPILYIAPLGLITYMTYLHFAFGDALYFWHAQPVFGASRSGGEIIFPLQVVWRYLKILTSISPGETWIISATELLAFLVGCLLLIVGHKYKVRLSYLIFGWLVLIIPSLTGTFSSLARYLLMAIPIFMVLGLIPQPRVRWFIWCVEFVGLIYFTLRFVSGHWVA